MKIILPGGSGQVGTILARALHGEGHEVVVLSRRPGQAPWRCLPWDGVNLGDWVVEFEEADVVINLAGRSVNCRYDARHRREIVDSRVKSTRVVGAAIACVRRPPRVWLQASTATIYAHTYGSPNDEATGVLGGDEADAPETWRFSIEVARAWERTFDEASTPGTRKIKLRSAMTMSPDAGGIFATLFGLTRCGLGGSVGDGRQYVSWIHEEDFLRAVHWLIAHEEIHGIVNLAAPHPLPYADFMRVLRQAAGVPFGLPATRWMLEIACLFLRTESELVLKSRRVIPARLLEGGFEFRYPEWPEAARALCAAHRQVRTS